MDAHRLCAVFDLVIAEHNRLAIDHKFGQLLQTLDACISQPSNASDEGFRSALTWLLAALRCSRTNDFVESSRRILHRIGGERLTGEGLAERVLAVANERPFLPARAKEEFVKLGGELASNLTMLATAQASLHKLNVESARRADDEYELGILLSDELIKGDLGRAASELKDWDQLVQEFLPAISARKPSVALRAYSAGCFELSVGLDRDGALALGMIIAGIDAVFRKVLVNRERVAELSRQNYPAEIVDSLKDYEQLLIQQGMKAIKEELTSRYLRRDGGGRKELHRLVERGLRTLAIKIREGAALEIVGPTVIDLTEETGEAAADDPARTMPHHVRAAMRTARARRPDQTEQTDDDKEQKAPQLPLSHITGEADGQTDWTEDSSQKAA